MNGSTEQWMVDALAWLGAPHSTRLPPQLAESVSTALAPEVDNFASILQANWKNYSAPASSSGEEDDEFDGYSLRAGTEDVDSATDADTEQVDAEESSEIGVSQSEKPSPHRLQRMRVLLQLLAARVLRLRLSREEGIESTATIEPNVLEQLAADIVDFDNTSAAHCLQILAAQADPQSLETLSDLLKRQLLADEQSVAIALSPLFQWPPVELEQLFELVGESIWSWQLLGPMLDLAGHSFRKKAIERHPLQGQGPRLRELLSATVQRLTSLEKDPKQFGDDVPSIQRVLSNAIVLTVSLCDTLGLIGDREAEGKLNQAMELSHRRVQTEAAGALARLGIEGGKARLLELAADPLARLRAVAYADELGMEDAVDLQWRSPKALAEAELVAWLADRDRFGVPPSELELIDERVQYWPSYEEPQTCFLWKFTYRFPAGELSNLAIAGPLVYAVRADIRSLPIDDVYGLLAGWQAEHEDIYEVDARHFNRTQEAEAERLLEGLDAQGIEDLRSVALTFFFGERAVLATGERDGTPVCAVSDGLESVVLATPKGPTAMTPDLVLSLYRGRKLLRSFN